MAEPSEAEPLGVDLLLRLLLVERLSYKQIARRVAARTSPSPRSCGGRESAR